MECKSADKSKDELIESVMLNDERKSVQGNRAHAKPYAHTVRGISYMNVDENQFIYQTTLQTMILDNSNHLNRTPAPAILV